MILSEHRDFRNRNPFWKKKLKWSELRVFFIGGYCIGENDHVRLWLQSLKDLGAQVYEFSTEEHPEVLDCKGRPHDYGFHGPVFLRESHLGPLLEKFDPHWVFVCAGGLSFTPYVSAGLRKKFCLTGMALSDPDAFEPSTQHICANFDRYFTNSRGALELYAEIGTKAYWFPFSCYPPYHRRVPPAPEFACDVLFIGQARPDRVELVKRVAATFDTKVFGGACFGADWAHYGIASKGFLSAQDFVTAANSAKVCVDFARNRAGDLMVKHRMFEFAACGVVTCTEHFPDLAEHFIYGKEILGYDTDDELICQIRKCLEDPAYRDRISDSAFRRSRAEHTFAHRWTQIAADCGVHVS